MASADMRALVGQLSEQYQPIYGHPEFDGIAARPTADRLALVTPLLDRLRTRLARPLRVLDLGCAQGYFSLALAARGDAVTGVDLQAADIALCRALSAEHPALAVEFVHGRAEDVLASLGAETFDVVLAFNVMHHVAHAHGFDRARALLGGIAGGVGIVLAELALQEEPLPWAASLPGDPRGFLAGFAFVHRIGEVATHLSPVVRPVFYASSRWCDLGGATMRIDAWSSTSHELVGDFHAGSRRYFECEGRFLKYFDLAVPPVIAEANRRELAREAAFLAAPPPELGSLPALVAHGEDAHVAWLVRDWIAGRRLSTLIAERATLDRPALLEDVLEFLSKLERAGLYHADLRVWNVIVGEGGKVSIIDYGDISGSPACAWPGDVFLSFIIFMHEISGTELPRVVPLRSPTFAPEHFEGSYRSFVEQVWRTPRDRWSFALFLGIWRAARQGVPSAAGGDVAHDPADAPRAPWQAAIEVYLDAIGHHQAALRELVAAGLARRSETEALLLGAVHDGKAGHVALLHEIESTRAERDRVQSRAQALRAELDEVRRELAREGESRRDAAMAEATRHANMLAAQVALEAQRDAARRSAAELEASASSSRQRLADEIRSLDALRTERDALAGELAKARDTAHHWWGVSVDWQTRYRTMEGSASWRVTAPLRWVAGIARSLSTLPSRTVTFTRRAARRVVVGAAAYVLERPRLRYRVGSLVARHPRLRARLRRLGRDAGLLPPLEAAPDVAAVPGLTPAQSALLTPRARDVLRQLRARSRRRDGA